MVDPKLQRALPAGRVGRERLERVPHMVTVQAYTRRSVMSRWAALGREAYEVLWATWPHAAGVPA